MEKEEENQDSTEDAMNHVEHEKDKLCEAGDINEDNVNAELLYKRRSSSGGIIPTPMKTASFLSKYITIWWMNSLLSLGSRQTLEASDLYGLRNDDQTDSLSDTLQRQWDIELENCKKTNKRPSLCKALVKSFGKGYMFLGVLALIADGLRIVQPLFLGQLINYFTEGSTMSAKEAYFYAGALGFSGLLMTLFNTPFSYMRNVYGMRVRVACTSLVYSKTLKLSNAALASTTTGNIVNLVSADTQKFDWTAPFLHYLVLGPLEVVAVLVLLWFQIGVSAFAGMGVIIAIAPLQLKIGHLLMALRTKALIWMDERVKIMNEVISGMKVIKMYTWEESFFEWITKLRNNELLWFLKTNLCQGFFSAFFFSSLSIICFASFCSYVMAGEVLTASKVFTCVSMFNAVRISMGLLFPIAITLLNDSKVSLNRMEELLLLDEMHSEGLVKSQLRPKPDDCEITVTDITATWNKKLAASTLDNISFKVSAGELLGIVGPVGSGKSSLLMAILGELPLQSGSINIKGKVAFASQQAWIYNSSVRHNIIFGKDYEEDRYNQVIKACALERDLELFSEGDQTLVGERGVSLSGGQRARLSLARAVYSDADIFLLDDPLSAVDANVARHLFDKCIKGYLANKACILVTHQLQFVKEANSILALDRGKCIAHGTFQDISRQTGLDFISRLKEDEKKDQELDQSNVGMPRQLTKQISRQSDQSVCLRNTKLVESNLSVMSAATSPSSVYEEELLPEETKQEGAVSFKTYMAYLRSFHNLGVGLLVVFIFAACQVVSMLCDFWLAEWSTNEELYHQQLQTLNSSLNQTSTARLDRDFYLGVYAALVFGLFILSLFCTEFFYVMTIVASKNLHGKMLASTMRTTMYFFDNNSIGRILNRFAKDMSYVDDSMGWLLCETLQTGFLCIGIMVLVGITNPVTLVVVLPVIVIFIYFRNYFMKSSREVKRIEGISRSPLFGHFSTTLLGLDTIRAFGAQETFKDQFISYQDIHSRAWFAYISGQAWLTFRLQILCVLFLTFVAVISPVLKDISGLNAGIVGLSLTYAIMLTSAFQPFIEQSAEVESTMTSVERIVEYCHLESEGPPETDVKPPKDWPTKGRVEFKDMSFSYHKGLPSVLHHITCSIKPNEKIGVVGRTGAGKSSLLSTLFRLAEPKGGIIIDGIDIRDIGLKDLRSKLSIIPQDPVLFSGTMRKNLDPFGNHSDTELWGILEEVQLKRAVEELPKKLDEELAESGSNFSVGQRQLVCLARAILRHSRILVIDEATANVDPQTDALIQKTIREKFKDCTVLTIAHRLHTIMDSHRVMVLDAGRLKEFDAPYILLQNHKSIFTQLVENTGPTEARHLHDIAKAAYTEHTTIIPETEDEEENCETTSSHNDVTIVVPNGDSSDTHLIHT